MESNYYNERLIGETGIVSNFNHNSQTIFFEQNYDNPVIFTQPLSYNGSQTAIVRIEDIQTDNFTAFLQEPNNLDRVHKNESFSYLVLEQGTWQLDDGAVLEVNTVTTDLLGNQGWENISFAQNFNEDPLVFSQAQTKNGHDFIVTRQKNVSSQGFKLTMQEEEALMNSGHGSETLGWLAISAGGGDWSQNQYQAGTTDNSVDHNWHTIEFDHSLESPILLASLATYNGADTSGLRSTNLNNSQVQLKIEEETSKDLETYHAKEEVNFLAIDGTNSLLYGSKVEAPNIITPTAVSVRENQTAVIDINTDKDFDNENASLNYSISGGVDQYLFDIDGDTGVLNFIAAPDFENPKDADADNKYQVQVTVEDSLGLKTTEELIATVTSEPSIIEERNRTIGETGIVSDFNHTHQTIFFEQNYNNPVIFAQPLSSNDSDAATIRIENIQSDRFTAFLQEPSNLDQIHASEGFSYLVLEEGTWQLDNGAFLEVDTVTTDFIGNEGWGNEGWENISFAQNFSEDPLIFSQVQTNNDTDFVITHQKNTSNRGFELTMQEEEASINSGHGSETLGWLAISAGSGDWSQNQYQAGTTGNNVDHTWHTINFENSLESPIVLASLATYNGADTSWLRSRGLNSNQVEIKLEEDTSADLETDHGQEEVNFLAIDGKNTLLYGSQVDEKFYYESSQKDTIHIGSYDSRPYNIGSNHSSVWTTDSFDGNFHRQITGDGEHFKIDLEATTGGFDTAMIEVYRPTLVDDIDSQATISSTIDVKLDGSGEWWVGPKFSVKENVSQGLHENYENYVVENASRSPKSYHDRLSYMGTYLGQTVHDGSTYKHYYNEHNTWGQFWAIRQDYRDTGSVSLKPILNMWRNNGLPNHYFNNMRTNIETSGELSGTVEMSNIDIAML